jgi:hypothetical protein
VRNIETERVMRPHGETIRRIAAGLAASGAPLAQIDVAPGIGTTGPSTDPAPAMHQLLFTGPDGVTKTALALNFAHQLIRHFPDRQLYIDLRGVQPHQSATKRRRVRVRAGVRLRPSRRSLKNRRGQMSRTDHLEAVDDF